MATNCRIWLSQMKTARRSPLAARVFAALRAARAGMLRRFQPRSLGRKHTCNRWSPPTQPNGTAVTTNEL
jgi:hypothetical protein